MSKDKHEPPPLDLDTVPEQYRKEVGELDHDIRTLRCHVDHIEPETDGNGWQAHWAPNEGRTTTYNIVTGSTPVAALRSALIGARSYRDPANNPPHFRLL
jgi:hypothetical protein